MGKRVKSGLNIIVFFMLFSFLFLYGCGSKTAVQEMALSPDDDAMSMQGNHILLLSIKTDNQFKPGWPPEVYAIEVVDDSTQEKIQISVQALSKTSLIKKAFSEMAEIKEKGSSWEGLLSFHLPPGQYHLSGVRGGCIRSAGIAVAMADFDFPFDIPFQVNHDQYIYLGRVEMVNRERLSDDEIPSGDNFVTKIPQKSSGFGTGTFDVTIKDNFDQDLLGFREKYPVLVNQEIVKQILPQWTKPKQKI